MPDMRLFAFAALPPLGAQAYVYAPVPPVTVTDAEPLALPQVDCVKEVVSASAAGCVTATVTVTVQLFASVTVTV